MYADIERFQVQKKYTKIYPTLNSGSNAYKNALQIVHIYRYSLMKKMKAWF